MSLAYASDNIVIAQMLGQEAVGQYSIAMRLFSIVPMIVGMFLIPLWPAYGESVVRGDTTWAKRTLILSLVVVTLVTGLSSLLLVVFGNALLRLWVGETVTVSFWLLLGLGVWMVLSTAGNAVAMFLNGTNRIGFQVVTASLLGVVTLGLKILLTRQIGLPGIIWGTVVAYIVCTVVPMAVYVPHLVAGLGTSPRDPALGSY